jgi:hypothetical protein
MLLRFILLHQAAFVLSEQHDHGFDFGALDEWHNSTARYTGSEMTVWVVPHSHDDTGWLSTVDEYFVNEVKWILETVTASLDRSRDQTDATYPKRIFSYVEIAYFERWWAEQDERTRTIARKLVAEGRLEFNLAGCK